MTAVTRVVWLGIAVIATTAVMAACQQQVQVDRSAKDVRLAQTVRDQLEANPDKRGATSRVRVKAKDGTVTLSGTTDTAADKSLAEQLARQTSGVTGVVNEIVVSGAVVATPGEPFDEQAVRELAGANGEVIGPSSQDARIYSALRSKIVAYEATPKKSIFVDVENGDVTLRGMVFSTAARDESVQAALKIEGVKAVRDLLKINSILP